MKHLNWHPKSDSFLKEKEIEIHHSYHLKRTEEEYDKAKLFSTPKRKFRINALNKAFQEIGQPISGSVLEVGAGEGWCSAYLLTNLDTIDEMYVMEINPAAINQLIPKVLKSVGAPLEKVVLVEGSFNAIPLKNHFDFIVAVGAIHHSPNLFATFKEVFTALKPGGWFIAQEPYMPDSTLNSFYFKRDEEVINFKGLLEVKNKERTDIFYRACEYRTAGFHAGFDYFDKRLGDFLFTRSGIKKYLKSLVDNSEKASNLVFYAQKPINNLEKIPPTSWE